MLSDPIRYRADTMAVSSLLKGLCGLQRVGPQEGPLTNGVPPGLREEASRIALSECAAVPAETNLPAAPARTWTFAIGTNAVRDLVPVLREEGAVLSRIRRRDAARLLGGAAPGEPLDFLDPRRYMDPQILDVAVNSIRRLTLTADGSEQTVTRDAAGNWAADSPPGAAAAAEAIAAVLNAVGNLRALRIKSLGVVSDPGPYGLGESAKRLTIGLTGTAGIQKTVAVGAPDGSDGVYARVQGQDVVFVISRETAAALARGLVVAPPP
jgi:hypothetical protein